MIIKITGDRIARSSNAFAKPKGLPESTFAAPLMSIHGSSHPHQSQLPTAPSKAGASFHKPQSGCNISCQWNGKIRSFFFHLDLHSQNTLYYVHFLHSKNWVFCEVLHYFDAKFLIFHLSVALSCACKT